MATRAKKTADAAMPEELGLQGVDDFNVGEGEGASHGTERPSNSAEDIIKRVKERFPDNILKAIKRGTGIDLGYFIEAWTKNITENNEKFKESAMKNMKALAYGTYLEKTFTLNYFGITTVVKPRIYPTKGRYDDNGKFVNTEEYTSFRMDCIPLKAAVVPDGAGQKTIYSRNPITQEEVDAMRRYEELSVEKEGLEARLANASGEDKSAVEAAIAANQKEMSPVQQLLISRGSFIYPDANSKKPLNAAQLEELMIYGYLLNGVDEVGTRRGRDGEEFKQVFKVFYEVDPMNNHYLQRATNYKVKALFKKADIEIDGKKTTGYVVSTFVDNQKKTLMIDADTFDTMYAGTAVVYARDVQDMSKAYPVRLSPSKDFIVPTEDPKVVLSRHRTRQMEQSRRQAEGLEQGKSQGQAQAQGKGL